MKTPSAQDAPGPTKGLRCRTLPVPAELHEWIVSYRAGAPADGPLFTNPTGRSRDRRWHAKVLTTEWPHACRQVGVDVPMDQVLKPDTHRATRGLLHVLKRRRET
jgi:hypothetical protein